MSPSFVISAVNSFYAFLSFSPFHSKLFSTASPVSRTYSGVTVVIGVEKTLIDCVEKPPKEPLECYLNFEGADFLQLLRSKHFRVHFDQNVILWATGDRTLERLEDAFERFKVEHKDDPRFPPDSWHLYDLRAYFLGYVIAKLNDIITGKSME